MASINALKLGDTVSFDVYPSAILGTSFKRVKVLAILDMDSARQWIDPVAMHINVYPTLPEGTPNRPSDYYYVKIRLPNGQVTCLGLPWIREETITVHDQTTMRVTIENIGPEDVERVIKALSANGYNAVDVQLV